jgi:hypothetical protein
VKRPGKDVAMKTLSAVVVVLVVLAGAVVGAQDIRSRPSLLKATFGKLPLYFIENRGVYPDEVAYYVQGADKTLYFTREGIAFRLKGKDRDWVVRLDFVGANPDVVPRGENRQQAVFSYFRGPQKDWKTGLKTYSKIVYRDLWPGIDLVYQGNVNRLKYEFVVAPGADPTKIRLRYRGVTSLAATESGALRVKTPESSFEDAPPEAWQEIDGKRVPVEIGYRLGGDDQFGFDVGDYDSRHPLVLDPAMIVYCGYFGGAYDEHLAGIAVDAAGNTYVTGGTDSPMSTFPLKAGPNLTHNGASDVFVAKLSPSGTSLVYCGYIGGSGGDAGSDIAVDSAGEVWVVGVTSSNEQTFPVTVGPDLTYNGGNVDAFVAKVNAQGTSLVYCGYVGGAMDDWGTGIAVDSGGRAFLAGYTYSTETSFPVRVGPDLTQNGSTDAFVARVSATGSSLEYCGFIGGTHLETAWDLALDAAGNAYVTGEANSTQASFPVTAGPDFTHNGRLDVYVAKVSPTGSSLVYCGYIGGASDDASNAIAVDPAGNAYVAGETYSSEATFPVTAGPDLTHNGLNDAFVAKVSPTGTALVYCGYVGGSGHELAYGIAVDPAGNACICGTTESTEATFPVKGRFDPTYNGGPLDAFVAVVTPTGAQLLCCGYIGGLGDDWGLCIAVDSVGNLHVAGTTEGCESTFPLKSGPDLTYNGGIDGFIAKIALTFARVSGSTRPGGAVSLALTATDAAGLAYQVGSSFGTGPIPIDKRKVDLSPDGLLAGSVGGWWPSVFAGYRGVIDSKGQALAAIHIPNVPALVGMHLHSAFVTLDPAAPSGIRSISNTESFVITK